MPRCLKQSDNAVFRYALIASCLIHAAVLARFSYSQARNLKKPLKAIDITYYILAPDVSHAVVQKRQAAVVDTALKDKTEVFLKKEQQLPLIKDAPKLTDGFGEHAKNPARVSEGTKKHKIVVPPLKSEEIAIPEYQFYYHNIRGLIKKHVLAGVDFARLDVGDVYLTFIVSSDGKLGDIKIIPERTRASGYLQEVSLASVKKAGGGFEPFPDDLQFPELPFNVVISFQLEE